MRCIISDKGRVALRREIHRKGGSFAVSAFPYGTPSSGKRRGREKKLKIVVKFTKNIVFFVIYGRHLKKVLY